MGYPPSNEQDTQYPHIPHKDWGGQVEGKDIMCFLFWLFSYLRHFNTGLRQFYTTTYDYTTTPIRWGEWSRLRSVVASAEVVCTTVARLRSGVVCTTATGPEAVVVCNTIAGINAGIKVTLWQAKVQRGCTTIADSK
jgi:hypothetical protein